jgi:hypothetical protein
MPGRPPEVCNTYIADSYVWSLDAEANLASRRSDAPIFYNLARSRNPDRTGRGQRCLGQGAGSYEPKRRYRRD